MRTIESKLLIFMIALAMFTTLGTSHDSWNLGSSDDWLSTGPAYHNGPFYHPNSNLPMGIERFQNSYPSYMPDFLNYYPPYSPISINKTGFFTPGFTPDIYYLGYNNPHYYDPQYELDAAIANHAYQKSLAKFYAKYFGGYPY